jgi:2-desacetyl-2-hydroxyethyl bacteriochlorophyllide A dehydrogenase
MRAAVLDGSPGRIRLVDDWPEPEPGPGEVLVHVRGVGICGSDLALHAARRRPPSYPWVVGHETYGEIAGTGQRVVIEPNIPCLACPVCRSGRTSACPRRRSLGFNAPGTLAERIAVPARFAWPVPQAWADTDAVCAEPFVVAHTAIRRARAWTDAQRCLVIGAGSQGALLCLALITQGVIPAVLEPHTGRLALAESLGACRADPGGRDQFDVIFETSGAAAALAEAVTRAAPGGLIMLIGQSGQPAEIATQTVVQKQLLLMGSLIYDHPDDFASTLSNTGSTRAGTVLRACYPMDEAADAFRVAREVPGKSWIRVGSGG